MEYFYRFCISFPLTFALFVLGLSLSLIFKDVAPIVVAGILIWKTISVGGDTHRKHSR